MLIVGGVEAFDGDGLGVRHKYQVKRCLDLECKFLVGDDVERAKFQGGGVILVI